MLELHMYCTITPATLGLPQLPHHPPKQTCNQELNRRKGKRRKEKKNVRRRSGRGKTLRPLKPAHPLLLFSSLFPLHSTPPPPPTYPTTTTPPAHTHRHGNNIQHLLTYNDHIPHFIDSKSAPGTASAGKRQQRRRW